MIETIVIDFPFIIANFIFYPDSYAERVGFISSPQHKAITIFAVDGAPTFESGIIRASNHQPVVTAAVEVQIARMEIGKVSPDILSDNR